MTLSSSSSIDGDRATNSYTLTHSLYYTVTEATTFSNYLTMIMQLTLIKFALVADMAHKGHIQTIYNYTQCSLPGLLIYRSTTPTTYPMFVLVQTIAYIRLPTAAT